MIWGFVDPLRSRTHIEQKNRKERPDSFCMFDSEGWLSRVIWRVSSFEWRTEEGEHLDNVPLCHPWDFSGQILFQQPLDFSCTQQWNHQQSLGGWTLTGVWCMCPRPGRCCFRIGTKQQDILPVHSRYQSVAFLEVSRIASLQDFSLPGRHDLHLFHPDYPLPSDSAKPLCPPNITNNPNQCYTLKNVFILIQ